jgi:hypothetical protein
MGLLDGVDLLGHHYYDDDDGCVLLLDDAEIQNKGKQLIYWNHDGPDESPRERHG